MEPKTIVKDVLQQVLQSDGTSVFLCSSKVHISRSSSTGVTVRRHLCFSYSSKVHISLCSSTGVITRQTLSISVAYFHYMLYSVHYRVNTVEHVLQQQYITNCRINTHPPPQTARHTLRDARALVTPPVNRLCSSHLGALTGRTSTASLPRSSINTRVTPVHPQHHSNNSNNNTNNKTEETKQRERVSVYSLLLSHEITMLSICFSRFSMISANLACMTLY
jgi:hypothetical protein